MDRRWLTFQWIVLPPSRNHVKSKKARRAFLKTPEDFSGPKAIFENQSLSIRSKVFSPKTSAKFFVDLRFFCLAFTTNKK